MENYKELLSALYKEHAPEKLDEIDFYLDKYKGKEKQFYIAQKAKYANKKSVKDSKKILEEAMARINKEKQNKLEEKPKKAVNKEKQTDAKPVKKEAKKEDTKKETIIAPVIPKAKNKEVVVEIKDEKKHTSKKEKESKEVLIPIVNREVKPKDPPKSTAIKAKKEIVLEEGIYKDPYKKQNDTAEEQEEKRRTPFMWILYLIIFFTAVAFVVYLFSYPIALFESKSADHQKSEQTTIIKPEETNQESQLITDEAQKNNDSDPSDANIRSDNQTSNAPTAERLYASDIQGTVIFVACFAEKKEELAQKKVAQLKEYGLNGHYYWIPDIDPEGNTFFKIVVGPFKTHREAYPSLTKVQERINFDAYILVVK